MLKSDFPGSSLLSGLRELDLLTATLMLADYRASDRSYRHAHVRAVHNCTRRMKVPAQTSDKHSDVLPNRRVERVTSGEDEQNERRFSDPPFKELFFTVRHTSR